MFTNRSVDRFAVTHKKDRSRLCAFTFADERKCRHPLTHLGSTPTKCKTKTTLTFFRINISKSVSKQRTLTFKLDTYENIGEGVQLLLTKNRHASLRRVAVRGRLRRGCCGSARPSRGDSP